MVKSAIIFLMLCATANAQYFVWTNDMGRTGFSTYIGDAQLSAAGAISTSSVMPYIAPTVPEPSPFPNGIISEGRIVAQGVDVEMQSPDTGVILVDQSTNKWLVTVFEGELLAVQISASPEITMEQRRIVLDAERAKRRALRDQLRAVRTNLAAIAYTDFAASQRDEMRMVVDMMQELRKVLRYVVKGSD
jgi:hypothetical protein